MAQTMKPPIFDAIDLEREIAEEFRKLPPPEREPQPTDFAPPSVRAPDLAMPDYVEHRDGATEIGKLSAEAVVREYEAAAKDIEALGVDLVEHVKKCEAMTRDALAGDRGAQGNRGAIPRGGQARLPPDRELLAADGGGTQDLC